MSSDFASQISMMNTAELDNQARELKKLLSMAGLDLESEMSEPEVMEIIKTVLKNYDPVEFGD